MEHRIPQIRNQLEQLDLEQHAPENDITKVTPSSKVMGDLAQFMVSQDLSLEDVYDRTRELAFPESVVQYLRYEISVPPGELPGTLISKVLKSCNLDPVEGRTRSELGEYDF